MNISGSKSRRYLYHTHSYCILISKKRLQVRPYILLILQRNEVLLFDISHKEDLEMSETEL